MRNVIACFSLFLGAVNYDVTQYVVFNCSYVKNATGKLGNYDVSLRKSRFKLFGSIRQYGNRSALKNDSVIYLIRAIRNHLYSSGQHVKVACHKSYTVVTCNVNFTFGDHNVGDKVVLFYIQKCLAFVIFGYVGYT